jgi:putative transport protein
VLVAGRRDGVVALAGQLGEELPEDPEAALVIDARDVVFTMKGMNGTTIGALRTEVDRDMHHGVFMQAATRAGQPLPLLPETIVEHGDVLTFWGAPKDTERAARLAGYTLPRNNKTDFIYMGTGITVGLLIGLLVVDVGGVPMTLGAGGGALLAGLLFGWMRGKRPMYGAMPAPASRLLQDFGLAGFVAVVGLNSGLQAVVTIRQSGLTIFMLGVVVTMVPLLLTLLFGRYVLGYRNAALLAGALSGARSANPAFGGVLDKADSAVPTVPFAITYALANVLLTLLGPLIVALV